MKEHFVEWGDFWKKIKYAKTCQSILKAGKNMPQENPLSYIALTNFYKFVTEKREKRSGGGNRRHCDQQIELELFFEEVEIFKPKIVIFQSLSFNNKKWLERLSSDERLIYVGPHPSYRRSTQPDFFCKQMKLHT